MFVITKSVTGKKALIEFYGIESCITKECLGCVSMLFDVKWQNFCITKIPMPILV